jgi:hypothetical protein
MTSTKMITELTALEARRAEVAASSQAARVIYTTAQEGFTDGTVEASDITAAHSAMTALSAALQSLDGKIADAEAAIRAAEASEEAEVQKARVSALTAEARAVAEQQFAVSREAQAALSVAAEKMLDLRARYDDLSREVRAISGEDLGTPEWQLVETQFAPLVLQAALLLAKSRGRAKTPSAFAA